MAKLTITDAAKRTGASRNTLYRAIRAGKLSRDPDDTIDTTELLRAGFVLRHPDPAAAAGARAAEHAGTPAVDAVERAAAPAGTPPVTPLVEPMLATVERERATLLAELAAAHAREAASREREAQWLALLGEEHKQRQRLLEAGVPPAAPPREGWVQRTLRALRADRSSADGTL